MLQGVGTGVCELRLVQINPKDMACQLRQAERDRSRSTADIKHMRIGWQVWKEEVGVVDRVSGSQLCFKGHADRSYMRKERNEDNLARLRFFGAVLMRTVPSYHGWAMPASEALVHTGMEAYSPHGWRQEQL
jgi:hypothetical protein